MKILSPIDKASEVDILADAGADEFYGGYVSEDWRGKYSMLGSANHRYFPSAQIASEKELKALIKAAHGRGTKFYLTMNAPYYSVEQYADLLEDAKKYSALGVDAFIISDLGLILRMRDKLPEAHIHLSTLGTIFNSESAAFFHRLGVDRMVFPRELTLNGDKGRDRGEPGRLLRRIRDDREVPEHRGLLQLYPQQPRPDMAMRGEIHGYRLKGLLLTR